MTSTRLPLVAGTAAVPGVDVAGLSSPASCGIDDDGCITCGDIAVVLQVRSITAGDAECVDRDGRIEVVAIDLVDAVPGDRLLVHARVAIEVVDRASPLGRQGSQ